MSQPIPIGDRAVRDELRSAEQAEREAAASQPTILAEHCCPDFNSQHGCTKQSRCPRGLWHRCGFQLPDGSVCGATNHGKFTCKRDPGRRGSGKGQEGGKDKNSAKGYDKGKGGTGGKRGGDQVPWQAPAWKRQR